VLFIAMRTVLNSGALAERRSFAKSFVKEVVVKDDEVSLIYAFPLLQTDFLPDQEVLSTYSMVGQRVQ
jgi:hypothetical protein